MGNVQLVRVKCGLNTLLRVFSLALVHRCILLLSHLVSIPSIANFLSIKLTQTNYLLWKPKIMSFIEAQDLLSFVDGTSKEPKEFLETDDKGEIMNPEYFIRMNRPTTQKFNDGHHDRRRS